MYFPETEMIDTERLHLRCVTPDVMEDLFRNFNDAEIMQFLGIKDPVELASEKEKSRRGFTTFNKSFTLFYLVRKESTEVIGMCGYHTWYTDHDRAEIGYKLFDDVHKRKGYMKEAMTRIIDYGFGPMKLLRVEAFVGRTNEPSLKLMKHFGFVEEGVLRKHYKVNGVPDDSVVFGLLKNEYKRN
jgi:ribosomal-protein-alanine N-acetyltransferase